MDFSALALGLIMLLGLGDGENLIENGDFTLGTKKWTGELDARTEERDRICVVELDYTEGPLISQRVKMEDSHRYFLTLRAKKNGKDFPLSFGLELGGIPDWYPFADLGEDWRELEILYPPIGNKGATSTELSLLLAQRVSNSEILLDDIKLTSVPLTFSPHDELNNEQAILQDQATNVERGVGEDIVTDGGFENRGKWRGDLKVEDEVAVIRPERNKKVMFEQKIDLEREGAPEFRMRFRVKLSEDYEGEGISVGIRPKGWEKGTGLFSHHVVRADGHWHVVEANLRQIKDLEEIDEYESIYVQAWPASEGTVAIDDLDIRPYIAPPS